MFGRGKSSSERVRGKTRWRGVWAAIATLCLSGGAVVSASPAFACDINNHCYAIASYGTSGLYGGQATIAPISGPGVGATGNFATDEVWLVGTNSAYWVEVGYIANLANVNGVSQGTSEFWFDSRPGGGAHGHVLVSNATLVPNNFRVYGDAADGYTVIDSNFNEGDSTNNTMTAGQFQVGSEVTTGSNVCSLAHDYNMQYSGGGGWVNFPSASVSGHGKLPVGGHGIAH